MSERMRLMATYGACSICGEPRDSRVTIVSTDGPELMLGLRCTHIDCAAYLAAPVAETPGVGSDG